MGRVWDENGRGEVGWDDGNEDKVMMAWVYGLYKTCMVLMRIPNWIVAWDGIRYIPK